MPNWLVHKFGGTSVANADCMMKVCKIIEDDIGCDDKKRVAIVVSAMGGKPKVTDMLLETVKLAASGETSGYVELLTSIRDKHTTAISDLGLNWGQANSIVSTIDDDIANIKELLRAVSLMRYENERIRELVSGYGEIWSCKILHTYLNQSKYRFHFINARDVIIVDEAPPTGPAIVWELCQKNMDRLIEELDPAEHLAITGFVASTVSGIATTLKRDGSDYRQVLFDVSYSEATELAYFGAKVIHPKTMVPAIEASIPIYIKNTFNPHFRGTRIFQSSTATQDRLRCVCGFATVDDIALLNVEGSGMIGVPGIAQRLFGSLHSMGISVILISQASSEHSICVAIESKYSADALAGIKETFYRELQSKHISSVDCIQPCCIVAAVGDGMSKTTGVAGRFFSALGAGSINVLAIAQGCSEKNISCVVRAEDSARALRSVHSAFLLSQLTIRVGLVGLTKVGTSFLDIAREQVEELRVRYSCDIRICAVIHEDRMLLLGDSTSTDVSACNLREAGIDADFNSFVEHVKPAHAPHSVIIDCTHDEAFATLHSDWLSKGIHVVSHNAASLGGDMNKYHQLLSQMKRATGSFQYEAAVGKGLPILTTLHNLISSGDVPQKIEGVIDPFSSRLMNMLSTKKESDQVPSFSEAVRAVEAVESNETGLFGHLLGFGAAREVLVLSRELGMELELSDIQVEPLAPLSSALEVDELRRLAANSCTSDGAGETLLLSCNRPMADLLMATSDAHCVLRYVTRIDRLSNRATLKLERVPFDNPFASLVEGQCCVRFITERMPQPLTLIGPTGGSKVIASMLFADLIRVARDLGARDKGHQHIMRSYSFQRLDESNRNPSVFALHLHPRIGCYEGTIGEVSYRRPERWKQNETARPQLDTSFGLDAIITMAVEVPTGPNAPTTSATVKRINLPTYVPRGHTHNRRIVIFAARFWLARLTSTGWNWDDVRQ